MCIYISNLISLSIGHWHFSGVAWLFQHRLLLSSSSITPFMYSVTGKDGNQTNKVLWCWPLIFNFSPPPPRNLQTIKILWRLMKKYTSLLECVWRVGVGVFLISSDFLVSCKISCNLFRCCSPLFWWVFAMIFPNVWFSFVFCLCTRGFVKVLCSMSKSQSGLKL